MKIKGSFATISSATWRLNRNVPAKRRDLLQKCPSYENIVETAVEEAHLLLHKRERAKSNTKFFRAVVILQVGPETVDLFHSSASGYRAQYYASVGLGERANVYALKHLVPRILDMLKTREKRTCPRRWLEMSLSSKDAKVWIHQGRWIRHAKATDRVLNVERWVHEQVCCPDPDRRKKARYAALAPSAEWRIDIKGAFFTLAGEPLGTLKPTRAWDIHDLGFT